MSKYVLVTSGVCSSLGKGVASSTIASLFECHGLKVSILKCDPYINVDAGNISPYQHGEVYVTEDGSETDLDLGTFSRFTSVNLTSNNCITIGKVYEQVIQNERAGRYNGRTVQVIPHITDEIKRRILNIGAQSEADIVVVEIGGTVGDIETIPYLETARQLIHELGKGNCVSVHIALVPIITGYELKSKPTQHSVKQLQEAGVQPDILLCRCEVPIDKNLKKKLALFCNVSESAVFTSIDVEKSIYELPVIFHKQGIDTEILRKLKFGDELKCNIKPWTSFLSKLNSPKKRVTIGLIGKRDYLEDCIKSVKESLFHAAVTGCNAELIVKKIDAEDLESKKDIAKELGGLDGILIPGNIGHRGFLGLLAAVKFARENKIPYLGIDLGMQLMAIETARNLAKWADADSTEFIKNTTHPIVSHPEEQAGLTTAGLMKLGASNVKLAKGSKIAGIYKKPVILERHRSKYTVDRRYKEKLEELGLNVSATCPTDGQIEAFEWKNHPWGIGVQYHPEFVSRPTKPHPLFTAFVLAALLFLGGCSVNYSQIYETEDSVPELMFDQAAFSRIERGCTTAQVSSERLEEFKDSKILARKIQFETKNTDGKTTASGSAGLMKANTKDEIYEFYNGINIESNTHNVKISGESLRWNGKTEQLTGERTKEITIEKDGIILSGNGFSASAVSEQFSFASSVHGEYEDKAEAENTDQGNIVD